MDPLASRGLNWLDDIFLLIVVLNVIASYREGLVAKLFGLLGLVAAIYGAGHLTFIGADVLRALHVGGPGLQKTLAFTVTFLVIFIGSRVAAVVLTTAAGLLMLGLLNRILGAAVGLVEGVAIDVIILFAILAFKLDAYRSAVQSSLFAHRLGPHYLTYITPLVPAQLHHLTSWLQ